MKTPFSFRGVRHQVSALKLHLYCSAAYGAKLSLSLLCLAGLSALPADLKGQVANEKGPVTRLDQDSPTRAELNLIEAAYYMSLADDNDGAKSHLDTIPDVRLKQSSEVAAVRRAAAVCGWLQNENQYTRARKLARQTLSRLPNIARIAPADRAERLYWEAWIEAEILDRKSRAMELLTAAEQIAPDDERLAAARKHWASHARR